ncbi:MAG TPA: hypothetical protein VE134_07415 [Methanomicrobiales archaeon]|nr:hypothetical protein [Methanomicrobiales archaeon]
MREGPGGRALPPGILTTVPDALFNGVRDSPGPHPAARKAAPSPERGGEEAIAT